MEVDGSHLQNKLVGCRVVCDQLKGRIAELEAEVERLREAINTHNDEKADQCLTNIKSGHCKPYTARGRRCPDCPLDGLIEALKESGDE